MVESIGICETHELPLDRRGECELCRLGGIQSKAPPSPSAWWAVVIPLVLLLAAIAWIISSYGPEPESMPQRGVRTAEPKAQSPARPEAEAAKPETAPAEPETVTAPLTRPIAPEEIPIPEPKPQSPDID